MTISVKQSAISSDNATQYSATLASAPISGNLLVTFIAERSGATEGTITSTGWTRDLDVPIDPTNGSTRKYLAAGHKIAGASESQTVNWTLDVASTTIVGIAELESDSGETFTFEDASNPVGWGITSQTSATVTSASISNTPQVIIGICYTKTSSTTETPWSDWDDGTDDLVEFASINEGGDSRDASWAIGNSSGTGTKSVTAAGVASGRGGILALQIFSLDSGGGTQLTETPTDEVGLTDSETVALNYVLDPIDNISLADQARFNTLHVRQDNVQLSDSFTVSKQISPSATDSLGLTEQIDMILSMQMNQTDNVNLSDPAVAALHHHHQITDTLGLTDLTTIQLGKFVLVTETIGLTDMSSFLIQKEVTDPVNIADQVTIALLYSNGYLDLANITDSATIELINNGAVSVTDILGISDTFTITFSGDDVATSLADQIMAWLGGLGYTGSIQDRQYAFLADQYNLAFGAPDIPLTSADMQVALGERVRDALIESEYS